MKPFTIDPNPKKPWGIMDPNSAHQLWSEWRFLVRVTDRTRVLPSFEEVKLNWAKFVAQGFQTTVGQVHVVQIGRMYRLTARVEGRPAHDPTYKEDVFRRVREHFVYRGFGNAARVIKSEVSILAGDTQDGKPPSQLLVMPTILERNHG